MQICRAEVAEIHVPSFLSLLTLKPPYTAARFILKFALFPYSKIFSGYPLPMKVNPNSIASHSGLLSSGHASHVQLFLTTPLVHPTCKSCFITFYSPSTSHTVLYTSACYSSKANKNATSTMASFIEAQV